MSAGPNSGSGPYYARIGVIVVMVLAATVLGMIGARLSPTAARAIPFLMPLIGLGAVVFFLSGNKNASGADPQ